MTRMRWPCSFLVLLFCLDEARAQLIVSYPFGGAGYYAGGGLGFRYSGRRLSVGGFAGAGYFVNPFWGIPVYSGIPLSPWGVVDSRVTVNIITPPAIVVRASRLRYLLEEEEDLSGVDLDVVGPQALEGRPPRRVARPGAPAKPAPEIAKAAPPPEKPAKAAPPPEKKKAVVKAAPPPKVPGPPDLPPPKQNPREESERLIDLGRDAFRDQLYGLAAFRFKQAVTAHGLDGRPHFLLSQAQFALRKYREAVETIQAGMKLEANWPLAPFQKLEVYKNNEGDFADHLKRLETAVAQEPKNADYLFLLGHVRWFAGQRDQAAMLFQRARPLAADPAFIDRFLKAAVPGPLAAK